MDEQPNQPVPVVVTQNSRQIPMWYDLGKLAGELGVIGVLAVGIFTTYNEWQDTENYYRELASGLYEDVLTCHRTVSNLGYEATPLPMVSDLDIP